ncbi:hypothetical protein XAB3213_980037 [Xanthomonas citri pv. bilvae]|nr:hypothetical protein XAB3213_980037 [Xanthomonas citri pv. bilvae]
MVVHRYRERTLGAQLPDHVLIQYLENLARLGQAGTCRLRLLFEFLADDVVAQLNALIADEYAGTGNQLTDFMLTLTAERAVENLVAVAGTTLAVFAHASVTQLPHPMHGGFDFENSTGPGGHSPRPTLPVFPAISMT